MAGHYLDFELPIAELEGKIEELSKLSESASGGFEADITALSRRIEMLRHKTYSGLDAWQKTQVARHHKRLHLNHYLTGLIEEFVELRGDRKFAYDQAIVGGLGSFRGIAVMVMGHEKGHDTTTRLKHNFGMARPEGYRKAVRLMDIAERFNLPVITFVDTVGAYPGIGAEERGQAEAIARSTERCLTLGIPLITTITGEGGSGGTLALAAANTVLILEHSIYSVISPEAASSIMWGDSEHAEAAANGMHITAQDLIKLRIVDRIIAKPVGGAHADTAAVAAVGDALEQELHALMSLPAEALRQQRADRFYAIGRRL